MLIACLLIWFYTFNVILSLYLHRGIAHRCYEFHPIFLHFCRFYIWLVGEHRPGYQQVYAAQHRKHHRHSDTDNDPHSPYRFGLFKLFDIKHQDPARPGYVSPEEINLYASDIIPHDDWIERNIYNRSTVKLMLIWNNKNWWIDVNLSLFILLGIVYLIAGLWGMLIFWLLNYLYFRYVIVFVTYYLLHKGPFKYVKNDTPHDKSSTVFPIGTVFVGEELHANHHNDPGNPCFSKLWWEFDIGWMFVRIFAFFGLLKLKRKI